MVLSDYDIRQALESGGLKIEPLEERNIQGSSIDLRLGPLFKRYVHQSRNQKPIEIDPRADNNHLLVSTELSPDGYYLLHPGEFVLGHSLEYLTLPYSLQGRVDGRSRMGRLALTIHKTAGLVNPGFEGTIVFEIENHNHFPIRLYVGMEIAQVSFESLSSPARKIYESRYKGQTGVSV